MARKFEIGDRVVHRDIRNGRVEPHLVGTVIDYTGDKVSVEFDDDALAIIHNFAEYDFSFYISNLK